MTDYAFSENNNKKRINLKAIVCVILALFMVILPFTDFANVETVAEAYAKTADNEPAIEIVRDGTKAYLYFKNCVGLTNTDFSLSFDPSVVAGAKMTYGEDCLKMLAAEFRKKNRPELIFVADDLSYAICGFYFVDYLWSSEKFEQEASGCGINGEYFHFATLTFELKSGKKASDVKITASGAFTFDDEKTGIRFIEKESGAVPETTKPSTIVPETTKPSIPEEDKDNTEPSGGKPVVEIVKDGAKAYLYFKNCTGLMVADFSVKLNSDVVASVKNETGKDLSKMQKSFYALSAVNESNVSDVRFSLVFADELCSSEEFEEKAAGCSINGEYFHFATLTMELNDGCTADDIKISAKGTFALGSEEREEINFVVTSNESEVESTEHSHKYSSKVTKKAGCTNTGVKTFICSCGDKYTEEIPTLGGHQLSWKVVKKATSFEEGKKEGKCKNCDYKKTVIIEKLPEIAVKPEKKNEIKLSGKDKVLSISGTDVSKMIESVPGNTVIQTAEGKEAEKDALIATGMKIVMMDSKGKVVDTRVVVVPGDVDCDGEVTASDARNTLRRSVGLEELDVYQTAAADIQQDKNVGADDARTILRNSVGLDNTDELFRNVS